MKPLPVIPGMIVPEINRTSPIFKPRKHTKQSYAAQNRAGKKRRNNRQNRKK